MKILIWIILYFVIGIAITIATSKQLRNAHGYSIRNFDELDPDDRVAIIGSLLFWPIGIIIFIGYLILDVITKVTNRKDGSEL